MGIPEIDYNALASALSSSEDARLLSEQLPPAWGFTLKEMGSDPDAFWYLRWLDVANISHDGQSWCLDPLTDENASVVGIEGVVGFIVGYCHHNRASKEPIDRPEVEDDRPLWEVAASGFEAIEALRADPGLKAALLARGQGQHLKGLAKYDGALRATTAIPWIEYACEEGADQYIYTLGAHLNCDPEDTPRLWAEITHLKAEALKLWARFETLAQTIKNNEGLKSPHLNRSTR